MRTYAKIYVSIWADEDFKALSPQAQALYFRLLTDPKLSMCGVADWRPNRLALGSRGSTAASIRKTAQELQDAHFIVADDDSEEVLIRSFVRHDGVLKSPNLVKGMLSDWLAISSPIIQRTVAAEVSRTIQEEPSAKGIGEVPEWFISGDLEKAGNPSERVPNDFPRPSPILHPATNNQQPAKTAAPAGAGRFEDFWKTYPNTAKKVEARRAYAKALAKVTDEDLLLAGAKNAATAWGEPQHRLYAPHASTWLNGERWSETPQQMNPKLANPQQPAIPIRSNAAPWTPEQPPFEIADDPAACDRWYRDQQAKHAGRAS